MPLLEEDCHPLGVHELQLKLPSVDSHQPTIFFFFWWEGEGGTVVVMQKVIWTSHRCYFVSGWMASRDEMEVSGEGGGSFMLSCVIPAHGGDVKSLAGASPEFIVSGSRDGSAKLFSQRLAFFLY